MRSIDFARRCRLSIVRRLGVRLGLLGIALHFVLVPGAEVWVQAREQAARGADWLRQHSVQALGGSRSSQTTMQGELARLRAVNGFPAKEIQCLALAVYFDGYRQSREAQIGVAQVALNRVAASKTPRDICRVVYNGMNTQNGCLFDATCRNIGALPRADGSFASAIEAAIAAADGSGMQPHLAKATHFHESRNKPAWTLSLHRIGRIGSLDFYATEFPSDPVDAVAAAVNASASSDNERQARNGTPRRSSSSSPGSSASAAGGSGDLGRRVFGID